MLKLPLIYDFATSSQFSHCRSEIPFECHSPFPELHAPLDVDRVGKEGRQLAVSGDVDRPRWALGFDSRLVGWDRVRQLDHFSIDHDVDVGRELVRHLLVRLKREREKSELNLKIQVQASILGQEFSVIRPGPDLMA